jgi:carbamoyl-phosphate synthase/aspartate carbamoyltransferase
MPRWDLDKFTRVKPQLGSQMKSVGEVMAIGRTFEESFQKAIRTIHMGKNLGFNYREGLFDTPEKLDDELIRPTPLRIYALAQAFQNGYSVDKVFFLSPKFLLLYVLN